MPLVSFTNRSEGNTVRDKTREIRILKQIRSGGGPFVYGNNKGKMSPPLTLYLSVSVSLNSSVSSIFCRLVFSGPRSEVRESVINNKDDFINVSDNNTTVQIPERDWSLSYLDIRREKIRSF